MQNQPEEQDGPEAAFEALRSKVAALRRGIELAYRQGPREEPAAPDYSSTLGAIANDLQAVVARLAAIERKPALAVTPAAQAAELRARFEQIDQEARRKYDFSRADLDGAVRELRAMMAAVRGRQEQQRRLWAVGIIGGMFGALLWFLATAALPWGVGTWLGGLAYGGRWARRRGHAAGRRTRQLGSHGQALQRLPTGELNRKLRGGDGDAERRI